MKFRYFGVLAALLAVAGCEEVGATADIQVKRYAVAPMAWDHVKGSGQWTRAGLDALNAHGAALVDTLPEDIAEFCPTYTENGPEERAQFWVGLFSALAEHESTWRPTAVGGGNQWYGLTQISPATARGYGCQAGSGAELLDGADNLSCAIRIAAYQVARDDMLVRDEGEWRGLARDWAPFRSAKKRAEMAAFTSSQPYCQ